MKYGNIGLNGGQSFFCQVPGKFHLLHFYT